MSISANRGLFGSLVFLFALVGAAYAASFVEAAGVGEFSGVVSKVTAEIVELRQGEDLFQLPRSSFPSDVKTGDRVFVEMRVEVQGKKDQKPGERGEQGEIIIDDRAFYNARNEKKQDSEG